MNDNDLSKELPMFIHETSIVPMEGFFCTLPYCYCSRDDVGIYVEWYKISKQTYACRVYATIHSRDNSRYFVYEMELNNNEIDVQTIIDKFSKTDEFSKNIKKLMIFLDRK